MTAILPSLRLTTLRPTITASGWGWFLLAPVLATLWTALALTQNNLEVQSIDICHYAMWIEHVQTPLGHADRAFVGDYPLLSIRVAALGMPLFDNPILALRAAALTSLLVMLIAQWLLLRTRLSPSGALLALVVWQCLCSTCKLGDANHFLWEWTYNYSRAVSAAALWVMILSFAKPPSRHRLVNLAVAIGFAAFAFRCHIAAGSLALATCGVWCIVNLLRRDWLLGAGGLAGLSVTAGLLLALTDEWRFLASLQHDNCLLSLRCESLVALWIPTAIVGLGIALGKVWRQDLEVTLTTAVLCALLPAAVLQSYMLYGKNVTHTIGAYPYNQMLFYTFGLSTLLWLIGILKVLKFTVPDSLPHLRVGLTGIAAVVCAWTVLETDARRKRVAPERDANFVLRELKPLRAQFVGHYYYDPDQEHASYFVSRAVLGAGSEDCTRYRLHCHLRKPQGLFAESGLKGLFIPASLDIDALLPPSKVKCPRERVGAFWKCDLEAWRKGSRS